MNILVALDLSEATEKILAAAERVANATGGKLWLLHVAEPEPDFIGYAAGPDEVRDQVAKEFHQEHRRVQELANGLRAKNIDTTALMIQGAIADTILQEAERLEAELIVVGSHGRGALLDMVVGSVSAAVLKRARIPTLVIPIHEHERAKRKN